MNSAPGSVRRPRPEPLDWLTPTLAGQLRGCMLRVAYRRDEEFAAFRRSSTAAMLGTAAHALLEAVERRRLAALEAEVSRFWDEQVEVGYRRLAEGARLGSVPAPRRWPGYQVARTAAIRRALSSAPLAPATPRLAPPSGRAPRPVEVEVDLADEAERLRGRVDRVETVGGVAEIIDYKTGAFGAEVEPSHRRQLLRYCCLWKACRGEWPARASIDGLHGERLSFDVVAEEALACLGEAKLARQEFNAAVTEGGDLSRHASPGARACAECDYPLLCPRFFAAASPSWDWYRRACLGKVDAVAARGEHVSITLRPLQGTLAEGTQAVRILGVPADAAPSEGALVAVTDALPSLSAQDLKVDWRTRMAIWEGGPGRPDA